MVIRERFNKKLLVEGNDDQHVIWALCQKFQVQETFDVIDSEGISNLLADIPVRAKQRDLKALGIVADADIDQASRWSQLAAHIQGLGYVVPERPEASGTIIPSPALNLPKIGLWLMPDNQLSGMIEDFARFLIPGEDENLAFAEETINALEERELQKYISNHRSKALMHTWIAWQDKPGIPLGQSTTKYLDTETDLCRQFVSWLNKLFNEA